IGCPDGRGARGKERSLVVGVLPCPSVPFGRDGLCPAWGAPPCHAEEVTVATTGINVGGLPPAAVYGIAVGVLLVAVVIAYLVGRRTGRRALSQRLTAVGSRLGLDPPEEDGSI